MGDRCKKPLYRHLTDAAQIPAELSGQLPLLRMTGQEELFIENYKGIVEYTDAYLLIRTKGKLLRIEGEHLYLSYYTREELKVTGVIHSICFIKGGPG